MHFMQHYSHMRQDDERTRVSEVCEQYRQRGDRLRERRTRPRSGSAQEAFGELRLCASCYGFAQNPARLSIHSL